MAKKRMHNPLDDLPAFDPSELEMMEAGTSRETTGPATIQWPERTALTAADQLEALEERLRQESQAAMALLDQIREQYQRQLETTQRERDLLQGELAREREGKLALERQLARLQVYAEQVQRLELLLQEERAERVTLEKKVARLEAEVEMNRKLETQLSEERTARINLQSRAAAAEARAARLEGELQTLRSTRTSRGFLDRLRGG